MKNLTTPRSSSALTTLLMLALAAALPLAAVAQTPQPLGVTGKLHYHLRKTYSPYALLGAAANAGLLQAYNSPSEWGEGGVPYSQRVGSAVARLGIHNALAFGLDSTLHQDPRYYRSEGGGFWSRSGHALRGTILTRTDNGGETFSTWRVGSDYGTAFLSDMWYPDRLNTLQHGFAGGSANLGFDLARNMGIEFWPDIKRMEQRWRKHPHPVGYVDPPLPPQASDSAHAGSVDN